MSCSMLKDDFDKAVKRIADQEFRSVMEMGLLNQETVTPIAQKMADSIREHFPDMTAQETEYHLRLLRKECRKTADRILKMAEETGWLEWMKKTESKEKSKDVVRLEPAQ